MRRYRRIESNGTTTTALDEDIKTAALEALIPSELEPHLAMNRARLITYAQVRVLTESRRNQFAFRTFAAKNKSDPMDVDNCDQGGNTDTTKARREATVNTRV